jgi:hypothetical protein
MARLPEYIIIRGGSSSIIISTARQAPAYTTGAPLRFKVILLLLAHASTCAAAKTEDKLSYIPRASLSRAAEVPTG